MVLCDIERIYAQRQLIDIFRRRDTINALNHPNPLLVPASTLLRREALPDAGGFDEALRTA